MGAVPEAGTDAAAPAGGRRWSFGTAVFDERSYELRVNGQPVELERKSLEVLRQLLYRAGEVVTKDELLELVWPGRIVSESVPAKCISRIREAIGDDAQAIIKTVHGYGYRLVASVKVETSRAATALTRLDLKAGDHPPLRPLWSLVRQLGAGGQGEIWLVRHDKTREERVYKFALDVAGLAAIKREITLSRFLRETLEGRDEFIRVLDWNLEEAPYYVELEHASGNLESWGEAQGGLAAVPLAVRLEIMAKVADALAATHSVGVLHKDLKPSNVLIAAGSDGAPKVKLADFGSGSVLDPERLAVMGITRMEVTKSVMQGDMPGTFMYLAPEVVAGQPATVQADVYSLGVMLYQMVIGDFRRPLAPGWEQHVGDPLLCEDIGLAVGDHAHRLIDASVLATRLRMLDQRWRQRAADQEQSKRAEFEKQAANERARQAELAVARLRARRNWMLTSLSVLIVGFALSLGLYLDARRARNEATAAAASSRAVADYLSKDLFAQVGAKPLRDLTVTELVESASASLDRRNEELPEVAAQLHAALGNAAIAVEDYELAERQLNQALASFEVSGNTGSEAAVSVAAQLLIFIKTRILELAEVLPRYERILDQGRGRLGGTHPQVLLLRERIVTTRLWAGQWKQAADEMRSLIEDQKAAAQPERVIGLAEARLGQMLVLLGDFVGAENITRSALRRLEADSQSSPLAFAEAHLHRAAALAHLQRFRDARREVSLAEELVRPWSATDDGRMLSVRAALGLVELRQARWANAASILEKTIRQMAGREWNKRSDATAEYRSWLAAAYAGGGQPEKALLELQRALHIADSSLGPRHPVTQRIRIELADLLRARAPAESLRLLASVDATVIAGLGADHPYAAERYRVEGLLDLQRGARDDARTALHEALRIYAARYGPEHPLSRRAQQDLTSTER